MADYRVTWSATGDTIGFVHNVVSVVSGTDLTFFIGQDGNVITAMNTSEIAFVAL